LLDLSDLIAAAAAVVVVVMTTPSSGANMRAGQMPQRDEEFHQIVTVLEHICDLNGVAKVSLAFCCPFCTQKRSKSSDFHRENGLET